MPIVETHRRAVADEETLSEIAADAGKPKIVVHEVCSRDRRARLVMSIWVKGVSRASRGIGHTRAEQCEI